MIELNLLPDVKKEFIRAQRTRNTVVSGAILVSIVAGGAVALLATTVYGAQSLWISNLKTEISKNHQELADKKEINKYLAIQSQLTALENTSNERSKYAQLFDYLPQLNPAPPFNVNFYTFNLDVVTNTITLTGAAENFEAVNNFKNTLSQAKLTYLEDGEERQEKPFFTSVVDGTPSLSASDGKVRALFDFTLVYSPEIFSQTIRDPKVEVPKLVTSDGDKNAPKELFAVPVTNQPEGQSGQ